MYGVKLHRKNSSDVSVVSAFTFAVHVLLISTQFWDIFVICTSWFRLSRHWSQQLHWPFRVLVFRLCWKSCSLSLNIIQIHVSVYRWKFSYFSKFIPSKLSTKACINQKPTDGKWMGSLIKLYCDKWDKLLINLNWQWLSYDPWKQ